METLTLGLPPLLQAEYYQSVLTITVKDLCINKLNDKSVSSCAFRIMWWGEKKRSVFRSCISYPVIEDLLETYLKLCQIVELTVTYNNSDIGSAFLDHPERLLSKSSFPLSIVDHQGCQIGRLVVEFVVSKQPTKEHRKSCLKKADSYRNFAQTKPEVPILVEKFLRGKTMTIRDEELAVSLLNKWSPSQSLVHQFMSKSTDFDV